VCERSYGGNCSDKVTLQLHTDTVGNYEDEDRIKDFMAPSFGSPYYFGNFVA